MYTIGTALVDKLIAIAGLGVFTTIGLLYPRSRMFAVPLAAIWAIFWILQAASAMGMSDRTHLLVVAIVAAMVTTIVTVKIPYTIEDQRGKQAKADALPEQS
jgi:ABC-type proline/glycine betaine transport system permease subunit